MRMDECLTAGKAIRVSGNSEEQGSACVRIGMLNYDVCGRPCPIVNSCEWFIISTGASVKRPASGARPQKDAQRFGAAR